jgi:hypothetical protein
MLAEFNGDMHALQLHLNKQRSKWEAAGFHYETEEERKNRLASILEEKPRTKAWREFFEATDEEMPEKFAREKLSEAKNS